MSYKIDNIEGIGPAHRERLRDVGIRSTDDLLELCCTPEGRRAIAEKTGLSEAHILSWTNMADLMRLSGVGRQFAELLEATGVDTIKELRNRNAENLTEAIEFTNGKKKLSRTTPSKSTIAGWIDQAKRIDPKITH